MQREIKRGASANVGLIFHVFAQDSASTTGAGKASIAYSSWACYYIRNGEAISGAITPQDIATIGTYAAPTANTNIRIKAVDNTNMIGIYEIQLHLDWVNVTNSCQSLTIYLTATGVAVLPLQINLVAYDPQDSAGLGLSRIDDSITSRASQTSLNTVDDFVDTEVAAIKAKTDNLPASPAAVSDIPSAATIATAVWANATRTLSSFGTLAADVWASATRTLSAFAFGVTVTTNNDKTGYTASTVSDKTGYTVSTVSDKTGYSLSAAGNNSVADQVWDEAIAGHLTGGTTGAVLNGAGSAGDPWTTALPGAYGAGTAGKLVGDNVNASIAAVKAKTDNLPAAPASVSDVPTALQNADALLKRDFSAVSGESSRSLLNAMRLLRNKWEVSGGNLIIYKEDDITVAWQGPVTTSPSLDPITSVDPT